MKKTETIKTPLLYRAMTFDRANADEDARTISLSFSSEMPVERHFGMEVLAHDEKAVRLDRLRSGGPLLADHDPHRQIGVVESAQVEGGVGRAVVRFSRSAAADEVFRDVVDGIRRNVSVGYRIHAMEETRGQGKGPDTLRATDWEPLEISIVSVPADTSVGVGRSDDTADTTDTTITRHITIQTKENRTMGEPTITTEDLEKRLAEQRSQLERQGAAEKLRASEILKTGDEYASHHPDIRALASAAVSNGKSIEEFRGECLKLLAGERMKPVTTGADIGMSTKEVRQYSVVKALRDMASGNGLQGLEKEASLAVGKRIGRDAEGFFIPYDVQMSRALQAEVATAGGYTVGTEVLGGSMIDLLRNQALVMQMGAQSLSGLVGNIAIPKHTGGATAAWLSETGASSNSQQTFGQLALTPHRLATETAYTKQLLAQSSIDIESFIRMDITRVQALALDLAAINGSGGDGEPLGIMNTTGINATVTFGGAPTWADVVGFETGVAVDNALSGNLAYLTTPSVRGKWKTTEKATNTGIFLWENNGSPVNGYRAEASNQVPSDKVIFGNFADLIVASWDGVDVVVDPYTLASNNQVRIVINQRADVGVRHAVSFNVSTDAGNQ